MPVIKIRRGTTTQWAASNRVLQLGELGLDTTLNKLKAGNGTTPWSSLPFLQADVDITELAQDAVATALSNGTHSNITVTYSDNDNSISLATGPDVITQTSLSNTLTNPTSGYVAIADVGVADGVASLDSNGKIPDSEIPSEITRNTAVQTLTNKTIGLGTGITSASGYDNISGFFGQSNIAIYQAGIDKGGRLNISSEGVITVANSGIGYTSGIVTTSGGTRLIITVGGNALSGTLAEFNAALTDGDFATESYVNTAVSNLVDAAPSTLNTLNELAAAINDDASYAATITTALGTKEPSLPSQANNAGKFLKTDGTNKSWASIPSATPTSEGLLIGLVDVNDENVALGPNSLNTTTTGVYNIAIGSFALTDITDGSANIGIGYTALNYVTTGSDNTAVGQQALEVLTTGSDNVAIGNNTMNAGGAATYNTAIGSYSLYNNESTGNTAAGYYAGFNNIGAGNVFVGQNAALSSTSGDNNIIIGNGADVSSATTDNQITLGNSSINNLRVPGLGIDWTTSNIPITQSEPSVDYYITNSGSGSYTVNGVDNGLITFEKGKKYRIHINASGHPFWIQTVSGAYSSGNVYSTGITNNGDDVGHILVELPQNAPDNLYYACQYHSSMQGSISVQSQDTITINSKSSSYTILPIDSGRLIEMSAGGTVTITDSSSFPVGYSVDILQTGSSQVTIAGNGFTPNATPGLKLRTQWSSATLVKRGLNSWVVLGDLSA